MSLLLFSSFAEALGSEVDDCLSVEVRILGMPVIEADILMWGQPLSLSLELKEDKMPFALEGDETLEPVSSCKIFSDLFCFKYLFVFLNPISYRSSQEYETLWFPKSRKACSKPCFVGRA